MRRSAVRLAAAAVLNGAALAVAACGGGGDAGADRALRAVRGGDVVVVGAAWPWETHAGVLYWQGMEMARDEINAEGGVLDLPLEILRVDDEGSVDRGRLVAQEFARHPGVVAVIGHLHSHVTVPAAAIYDLNGLVLVAATATSPELTSRGYRRVFRTIFDDHEVGQQMARVGISRGLRRFVIYYVRNEYGRRLANAFEEEAVTRGAEVVSRRSYEPNLTGNPLGAEAAVTQWSRLDFDAVFIAGEDRQAGLLAVELRRQGRTVQILGSDALATATFLEVGGTAVEGAVIPTPFHPDAPNPRAQRFAARFRERYGTDPDVGAALGYDAVHVLAGAIRDAGAAEPDRIAAALREMRDRPAVTGPVSFDRDGNLVGMSILTVTVRGNRFELEPSAEGER